MPLDPSNRYRDQISTFQVNPYSDHPDAIRARKLPNAQNDRIESSQEKLERSILEQFKHNNFRLPVTGKYIIIAHAGRFLVLAIVMPPYIFFYGMPKWMLQQVIPVVSEKVDQLGTIIEKLYLRISAWGSDIFSELTKNFRFPKEIKKRKKRTGETFANLSIKLLRQAIQKMNSYLSNVLYHLKQSQQKIQRPVTDMFQKFIFETKNYGARWRELLAKQSQKIALLAEGFRKMTKNLKKSSDWMRDKWSSLGLIEKIQSTVQTIVSFIPPLNLQLLKPNFASFKKALFPLAGLQEKLTKPLEIILRIASDTYQWVQNKVITGLQWMSQAYTVKVGEPSVRFIKKIYSITQKVVKRVSEGLAHHLRRLKKPIIFLLVKLLDQTKKRFKQFSQKTNKYKVLIRQAIVRLRLELTLMPARLLKFLKWLLKTLYFILKKTVWGIRVGLTWAKIIVLHRIKHSRFDF